MSLADKLKDYEIVVGLEIHTQMNTNSKAYSNDINEYGSLPNHNVSVISLGHPGTLPVANTEVIKSACKLGLALGCNIRREMHYARKNYFYPDLPKGYQITQDTTPICTGGVIEYNLPNGDVKRVNITRIHMEEDAGKSLHDQDPENTLVDLNRAGVPLLEIVSEPELRSGEEAYYYVAEVRKIVRYLGISDGNMEEGSLRCDANISVRKRGSEKFGTRTEVKNINSFRNVQRAIEFEAERQIELIENGGTVVQETRGFNAVDGTTSSLRTKAEANDYRYFPEPDLSPVVLSEEYLQDIKAKLPKLPRTLKKEFMDNMGLSDYDAQLLIEDKDIAHFFISLTQHTKQYKSAANWVLGDVKSHLNNLGLHITQAKIDVKALAEMIELIQAGKINNSAASQKIFPLLTEGKTNPEALAKDLNLIQDSSDDDIIEIAKNCLAQFPDKVEAYKNGNKNLLGLFMGQFMKAAKGKADPKKASQIIQSLLDE